MGAFTAGDVTCVVELGSSPLSVCSSSSITLAGDVFAEEAEVEEPVVGVPFVVVGGWTTPMSERDGLRMRLRVVLFLDDDTIVDGLDTLIFPAFV